MNFKLLNSILLGILALGIPLVDSRSIPASVLCPDNESSGLCLHSINIPGGPVIRPPVLAETIASQLDRRAGGRPIKGKPKEGESGGASSGSGGETTEGQRAGTEGGTDGSQSKTGGSDDQGGGKVSGDSSDTQGGGRVSGGSKTTSGEESVPDGEGPKSKRNNNNTPAQKDDVLETKGLAYNEEHLRAQFRQEIERRNLQDVRDYFFYSGTYPIEAVNELRPLYAARLKDPKGQLTAPTPESIEYARTHLPAMNDIRENPRGQAELVLTDKEILEMDYYWAAHSKAYAQIAKGNAILAIRLERTINQAADGDRGTFWWTWEIAELTRNPNIDNIKIIAIDSKYKELEGKPDPAAVGEPITIWSKGDPPLSFPADLKHVMARPEESLSYDELFEGNKIAKAPPEWESIRGSFGPPTQT